MPAKKTDSPIMDQLIASPSLLRIENEDHPLIRLSLRRTFKLMRIMNEGLGDLFDLLVAQADANQRNQPFDMTFQGLIALFLQKEEVICQSLALIIGKTGDPLWEADPEWVATQLTLDQTMKGLTWLIEAELTPDFFEGLARLKGAWMAAKTRMSPEETPTPGSGESLPS